MSEFSGGTTVVVGLQYGDEGKAKIVDTLAAEADAAARTMGGSNAGHTVELKNGEALALHQIPSGIRYPKILNVIASGVYLDPVRLNDEMINIDRAGFPISARNLMIDGRAHVVLPVHKELDGQREKGKDAQGTTAAGISFISADQVQREGKQLQEIIDAPYHDLFTMAYERRIKLISRYQELFEGDFSQQDARTGRLGEWWNADAEAMRFADAVIGLRPFIGDTMNTLNQLLEKGKSVLLEGAQAYGLDLLFGKYPYVTSARTTTMGLMDGCGIDPWSKKRVVGVVKGPPSQVGGGTFVTEITDPEVADRTRGKREDVDGEYGATTGRRRKVGYLDLVQLENAITVTGTTEIALTKFDCIRRHGRTTLVAVGYEMPDKDGNIKKLDHAPSSDADLSKCSPVYEEFETWTDPHSKAAKKYLRFVEDKLNRPITMVGTGPGRKDLFIRHRGKKTSKR